MGDVFPAPAGMNRVDMSSMTPGSSVPRACGDEPMKRVKLYVSVACVPRACGDEPCIAVLDHGTLRCSPRLRG